MDGWMDGWIDRQTNRQIEGNRERNKERKRERDLEPQSPVGPSVRSAIHESQQPTSPIVSYL